MAVTLGRLARQYDPMDAFVARRGEEALARLMHGKTQKKIIAINYAKPRGVGLNMSNKQRIKEKAQRRTRIVEVCRGQWMQVSDLVEVFGVSACTLRVDVRDLHRKGFLERRETHSTGSPPEYRTVSSWQE